MESTGVPGRIHISEDTAAELRYEGKEEWLTPRPDSVVARGKGTMDTYFIAIPAHTSAGTSNPPSFSSW